MRITRPPECPACGHERIVGRPARRRTETGAVRLQTSEWTCQLCDYSWSHPLTNRRDLVAGTE